jgi:hypothetical protein
MSLQAEIEELVKWISDLSESHDSKPKPVPLYREDWRAISENLKDAAAKYSEARVALLTGVAGSHLAEFAGDLERETESLALRAYMLSRRAARKPTTGPPEQVSQPAVRVGGPPQGKPDETTPEAVDAHAPSPTKQSEQRSDSPRSATDSVKSASGTVETAHEKLGAGKPPDDDADAFDKELDLLAEMTLSLHQQCRRLDAMPDR